MYDYYWEYSSDFRDFPVAAIIVIIIVGIGINIGLSFIPANMAKKKGYSFAGFYCLSFFVSFVIAIIIAALIQDKRPPQPYWPPYPPYPPGQTGMPYAPYGQPYMPYVPYGQPYQQPPQPSSVCPGCGAMIAGSDPYCPKCGAKMKERV